MFHKSTVMARNAYDLRFCHLCVRFTPHLWREPVHSVRVCYDRSTGTYHKVYEVALAWFWVVYKGGTDAKRNH